jgi:adenosylcobinamide-phosphate synthase
MMGPAPAFASAALALALERLAGYPDGLYQRIGHPVTWMGALLTRLETRLNRPAAPRTEGRLRGAAALAVLLAASIVPAWLIANLLARWPGGWVVEAVLATAFIAQKSMGDHVRDVYRGLGQSLAEGRRKVSLIVGRDPAHLDESGVTRAALESLAENTSDGIVAPALWYALLGFPGLVAYKAINTADSMIGHKSERYLQFGWAAARLDDLVNLPASRLSGLLFCAAAGWRHSETARQAFRLMRRAAPRHVSPNAGWPEAALAAGLGLRLGGPRSYGGRLVDLAWMGEGRETLRRDDILAGLTLYKRLLWQLLALAVLGALIL